MIRATQVRGQHRWSEPPADTVVLDTLDLGPGHRQALAQRGGVEFGATVLV